jgi:hypothetical protein
MKIVKPISAMFLVPDGTREANYAEHQPQYETLPSLVTPDGKVISQWLPDAGEIEMLKNGVPITLVCYTFNRELQPVTLAVGGLNLLP